MSVATGEALPEIVGQPPADDVRSGADVVRFVLAWVVLVVTCVAGWLAGDTVRGVQQDLASLADVIPDSLRAAMAGGAQLAVLLIPLGALVFLLVHRRTRVVGRVALAAVFTVPLCIALTTLAADVGLGGAGRLLDPRLRVPGDRLPRRPGCGRDGARALGRPALAPRDVVGRGPRGGAARAQRGELAVRARRGRRHRRHRRLHGAPDLRCARPGAVGGRGGPGHRCRRGAAAAPDLLPRHPGGRARVRRRHRRGRPPLRRAAQRRRPPPRPRVPPLPLPAGEERRRRGGVPVDAIDGGAPRVPRAVGARGGGARTAPGGGRAGRHACHHHRRGAGDRHGARRDRSRGRR